ncbi:MAG: circularly permuted type 2 ATP-grasp protein [Verrucomicrobiae bacterium]|nr:circularly permuted type 2 ATP-grasp protein [Verrucomicrobiae bacterium]
MNAADMIPSAPQRARRAGPHHEVDLSSGPARDTYSALIRFLQKQEPASVERIQLQARRLLEELGVTFNLYRDGTGRDHIISFDPFPRVITPEDWQYLSKGVAQRIAIWNAFFRDIYDGQEILKAGIIPFEIIYDDPHYQRACMGVRVPTDTFVHVGAVDLARNAQGQWMAVEDFVSNPTGAIYALQSRHVLGQICPELFDLANVQPIGGYPTELVEHLRGFSSSASSEPRVVLLSPGSYNVAYFEHSYLARQMGIPLVRGNDLIVLNSRVYIKTIGGLEPIDVIYRRMDDRYMDPLAFQEDSQLGIPGLMTCVRKGTVTIANALGTGLGDNRALMAYLPRMAKFYLGDRLLLPTVKRFVCHDPDQLDHVLEDFDNLTILATTERSNRSQWIPSEMSEPERKQLREQLREHPGKFVGEQKLPLSLLPTTQEASLPGRHAGLRLFALAGRTTHVSPCTLTRFALGPDSAVISSGLGGGIKDTWILTGTDQSAPEAPAIVSSAQRRLRMGSRVADNLFWIGRYAERAENTTRILRVLQQIQLEDQSARHDPLRWAPLWEALASATGHPTHFFKRSGLIKNQNVSHYILLDQNNPSSVYNCLERSRFNAQATRESIPPEVWVVLSRLHGIIERAAFSGKFSDQYEIHQIQEVQDKLLNQLDALSGAVTKTMLHDDGWHFWQIGVQLERAVTTLLVTRQVFIKRQGETNPTQRLDANLDTLLRMLSSLYAYRSLYQSRPAALPVAMMLVQDPQLPRSVLYCLREIEKSLRSSFGESLRDPGQTPLKQCSRLCGEVAFVDLEPLLQPAPGGRGGQSIGRLIDDLTAKTYQLATAISDHYLHHQAFNILR